MGEEASVIVLSTSGGTELQVPCFYAQWSGGHGADVEGVKLSDVVMHSFLAIAHSSNYIPLHLFFNSSIFQMKFKIFQLSCSKKESLIFWNDEIKWDHDPMPILDNLTRARSATHKHATTTNAQLTRTSWRYDDPSSWLDGSSPQWVLAGHPTLGPVRG